MTLGYLETFAIGKISQLGVNHHGDGGWRKRENNGIKRGILFIHVGCY